MLEDPRATFSRCHLDEQDEANPGWLTLRVFKGKLAETCTGLLGSCKYHPERRDTAIQKVLLQMWHWRVSGHSFKCFTEYQGMHVTPKMCFLKIIYSVFHGWAWVISFHLARNKERISMSPASSIILSLVSSPNPVWQTLGNKGHLIQGTTVIICLPLTFVPGVLSVTCFLISRTELGQTVIQYIPLTGTGYLQRQRKQLEDFKKCDK
jgi:hypothetical protein